MSNKFLSKGYAQAWVSRSRRQRPVKHPGDKANIVIANGKKYPIGPKGENHAERRKLKARERILPSFSRETKKNYLKEIDQKAHKEAVKNRLIKKIKPTKKPFVSKRSLRKEARLKNNGKYTKI